MADDISSTLLENSDELQYDSTASLVPATIEEATVSTKDAIYKYIASLTNLSSSYKLCVDYLSTYLASADISSDPNYTLSSDTYDKYCDKLSSVSDKCLSAERDLADLRQADIIALTAVPEYNDTSGLDVNYSHTNQWYAMVPLANVLGREFSNIVLHLTRFNLPQMQMGSTEVHFRGYTKEISTKTLNYGSKRLTLEYIIDDNWRNYKALYSWMSHEEGNINPVLDDTTYTISPTDYIPLHIYLQDNFKRKVVEFEFQNCWIIEFNDLALDVQSQDEIPHSFTMAYDAFKILEGEDATYKRLKLEAKLRNA